MHINIYEREIKLDMSLCVYVKHEKLWTQIFFQVIRWDYMIMVAIA